jgi:TRAP-type uncharacterized transport system fused permease subunit
MLTLESKKAIYKNLVIWIGAAMSLFHILVLGFFPMESWQFRIWHVTFAFTLIFLVKSFQFKNVILSIVCDWILILALVGSSIYMVANLNRLVLFIQFAPTQADVIVCAIGVILTLIAVWKTNGYVMPLLAVIFITYAWWGKLIGGILGHNGYSLFRTLATSYSTDGVIRRIDRRFLHLCYPVCYLRSGP